MLLWWTQGWNKDIVGLFKRRNQNVDMKTRENLHLNSLIRKTESLVRLKLCWFLYKHSFSTCAKTQLPCTRLLMREACIMNRIRQFVNLSTDLFLWTCSLRLGFALLFIFDCWLAPWPEATWSRTLFIFALYFNYVL